MFDEARVVPGAIEHVGADRLGVFGGEGISEARHAALGAEAPEHDRVPLEVDVGRREAQVRVKPAALCRGAVTGEAVVAVDGATVREDVWPLYRAFTEKAVVITMKTLEKGQAEGVVDSEADIESLARLFTSSSQSIARLQLSEVDPSTVRRFQETVMRAMLE